MPDLTGLTLARSWVTDEGDHLLLHRVYRHPRNGACIRVTTRV